MADKSFFGRLKRLMSTSSIVARVGDNKLKVLDYNRMQAHGLETNRLVDRYTKLYGSSGYSRAGTGPYAQATDYQAMRLELYYDYETMDTDSVVASALDIYADECTLKDEFGDVLTINSSKDEIKKIVHNLFYDVLNIEFNLWPWIRNMCKYGDMYLKLDITEGVGITNAIPMSPYEMIRSEGFDPENPERVTFLQDPSLGSSMAAVGQLQKTEFENYEVAHFRLLADTNFIPYGKSMLEAGRKVWKQLVLMEDAMLIHRIMRAPERRIFKIDIGNIPPAEVDTYMERVMSKMKKTPFMRQDGQYDLKYNMMNMLEDYYLPVRGANSSTEIDTLSGMEFTGIEDIKYLQNRMLASFKIPKAFIGYSQEDGLGGKATLAAEDVRFARTIERLQRIVLSELIKLAIIHLYSQGYNNEDLVDFSLNLTNPSIIYETEKINLWDSKTSLASSMRDLNMLSEDWIYKNVFNFSPQEMDKEREEVLEDTKQKYRLDKIEQEGTDPAKNQEEFEIKDDSDDTQYEFEGEKDLGGRPKLPNGRYGTDSHPMGRDPIGSKSQIPTKSKNSKIMPKYKGGSPLARENVELARIMKKSMAIKTGQRLINEDFDRKSKKKKQNTDKGTILDEENIINDI